MCIWYINSAEAGCRTSFALVAALLLEGEWSTCPAAQLAQLSSAVQYDVYVDANFATSTDTEILKNMLLYQLPKT